MTKPTYKNIVSIISFLILLNSTLIFAQSVIVPIDVQVKLLPKILSLDKNMSLSKSGDIINIGIIYDGTFRSSVKIKDEILSVSSNDELKVNSTRVHFIAFDLSSINNLTEAVKNSKLDAVIMAPVRGYDISQISKICRDQKIVSFTSVPEFLNQGLSIAFSTDDNRLIIAINLDAAKSEGANFSSHLLKIAKLVQ